MLPLPHQLRELYKQSSSSAFLLECKHFDRYTNRVFIDGSVLVIDEGYTDEGNSARDLFPTRLHL